MKAFPWQERLNSDDPNVLNPVPHGGMDLRDYFAAKAMQALITSKPQSHNGWLIDAEKTAYLIADAMMKAREA